MNGIEGHARIPPPGWEDIRAEAAISGITAEQAADKLIRMRAKEMEAELADPLHNGYEPPIWHVCDALLGFTFCYDKVFLRKLRQRYAQWAGPASGVAQGAMPDKSPGSSGAADQRTDRELWDEFCARMLKCLGYERPVKALLILGGHRSSKSEYPAKRSMMMVAEKEHARICSFHMSDPRSVTDQQPLFWKYMPLEWQIQIASLTAYIKYKKKTGFSENSFITPNGAMVYFLNYQQNKDVAFEGKEMDLACPDELIPVDWIEDIILRLATRAGKMITTFTPKNGYTPSVKMFCDSARVVRTITAYLCPRDNKETDEARALNLTPEQYTELWQAVDKKRAAMAPQCEPEDVIAWLEEEGTKAQRHKGTEEEGREEEGTKAQRHKGTEEEGREEEGTKAQRHKGTEEEGREEEGIKAQRKKAQSEDDIRGRVFDQVPRIMRCVDPRKAVVFFNPSDNPYGNPKEVVADLRKKARWYVRERFYGMAEKSLSVMIPKFNRKIHIIPASRIPTGGTNYFFYDPASDRNSFMSWFKRKGRDVYLYREWPGKYHIPGVGIPGPWAIPSGRKDGLNDGDPGEGQRPAFGFGNARYKFEMARLERWADWKNWKSKISDFRKDEYPTSDELEEWDERNGAEEQITARFIDSRAASAPRVENDMPKTLLTCFDDLNVFFFLTPGKDIDTGVGEINSALDYELEEEGTEAQRHKGREEEGTEAQRHKGTEEDLRFINPPHFFISEECENSIYAIENWMNSTDGQNGACKDPIDLMRYFFMAECEDVGPNDYQGRGGVSYGREYSGSRGTGRVHYGPRRLRV
jgi:hypothetical protein